MAQSLSPEVRDMRRRHSRRTRRRGPVVPTHLQRPRAASDPTRAERAQDKARQGGGAAAGADH